MKKKLYECTNCGYVAFNNKKGTCPNCGTKFIKEMHKEKQVEVIQRLKMFAQKNRDLNPAWFKKRMEEILIQTNYVEE